MKGNIRDKERCMQNMAFVTITVDVRNGLDIFSRSPILEYAFRSTIKSSAALCCSQSLIVANESWDFFNDHERVNIEPRSSGLHDLPVLSQLLVGWPVAWCFTPVFSFMFAVLLKHLECKLPCALWWALSSPLIDKIFHPSGEEVMREVLTHTWMQGTLLQQQAWDRRTQSYYVAIFTDLS